MTTHVYKVKGMHCASCASIITKKISALPDVRTVSVNYGNEKAKIEFEPGMVSLDTMNQEIGKLGYTLINEKVHTGPSGEHVMDEDAELVELEHKNQFMLPVTLAVFILMMWDILARSTVFVPNLPIPMALFEVLSMIISSIALFWVGTPYLRGLVRFLRHGVANMDTLIGIGTSVAYVYSMMITLAPSLRALFRLPDYTYFDVVIVVIGFITLGKFLEARSKKKTGEAIEQLLHLQAKTALVLRDGKEVEIPVEEVLHGELIMIKPAGKIPVDGILTDGSSFVDESMITGEPIPTEKNVGDTVIAGTINTSGAFTFKATKVGNETTLAHIIQMVDEAQGSKAPIQALADKIAGIFVPIVLGIAFVTLALWIVLGNQYIGFSQALSYGLMSFVGVLVIACPCALGLATPTAIIVGVGKGAKNGILIKDAATLEKLHKVTTVVVDKTGTITNGKPVLVSLENFSRMSDEQILSILASLEKNSEHPIAHAIVTHVTEKQLALSPVGQFESMKGRGLRGNIENIEYFAGNLKLIDNLRLTFPRSMIEKGTLEGKTPVILATKDAVLAVVMVADTVKDGAVEAILRLHDLGIRVVMLTGDNIHTAQYIATQVGIDEVIAEVMPEEKLNTIKRLQSEGKIVAMAGDGVNDAPALAQADVGIAMATGTDVAIESAGITLLHGDILKIVKAINLSKLTMRGIKQNLFWAFIYNIVGIPLAAGLFYPLFGWLLNPVFAGLAMAFSSVSVVSNSLRLKMKKI